MLNLLNSDHAYLFGLLQTDGNHRGDIDHKGSISLEMKYDDVNNLFIDLQKIIPWKSTIIERVRNTNFSNNSHTLVLSIFDQNARKELYNKGLPIGKKSYIVAPPTSEFNKAGYLRGIFDGNGSVGFTKTGMPFVSISCPSKLLAEYIIDDLFLDIGDTKRNLSTSNRDNCYSIMVANEAAAKVAKFLYPDLGVLGIPRKVELGVEVSDWVIPKDKAWRYNVVRRNWTEAEDVIVMSDKSIFEIAQELDRTEKSVNIRRVRLRKKLNL